jgi:hypothetical protein
MKRILPMRKRFWSRKFKRDEELQHFTENEICGCANTVQTAFQTKSNVMKSRSSVVKKSEMGAMSSLPLSVLA